MTASNDKVNEDYLFKVIEYMDEEDISCYPIIVVEVGIWE